MVQNRNYYFIVKILLMSILCITFSAITFSQPITWQKIYWDEPSRHTAYSCVQLPDEGYIVIGSKTPEYSVFGMRLDKYGSIVWRKFYPGLNPRTIVRTLDGNFLIGSNQTIKIDINGEIIWHRPNRGYNITLTKDGGYFYFGGKLMGDPSKLIPAIMKYDSLGFLQFEKNFHKEFYTGGLIKGLINSKGNLVITGSYSPTDTLYDYPFIMETSPMGEISWLQKFSNDSMKYTYMENIVEINNSYMVTSSPGLGVLIKFNKSGLIDRYIDFNTKEIRFGSFESLNKTFENDLIMTGFFLEDDKYFTRLTKTDQDGKLIWTKLYGNKVGTSTGGHFATQTKDSGFIITGIRDTFQYAQAYVIKTDISGNTSPYVNIVSNSEITPENFKLHQNYPNPFNGQTNISFEINQKKFVELTVYNILGQKIFILISKVLNPGFYNVKVNFDNSKTILPSGIYFYTLNVENTFYTKKLSLIK